MRAHAPIRQPDRWGTGINRNMFASAADLARHQQAGADADSIAGDPQFVDPKSGDYQVDAGSPALRLGFRNFPMDRFGVKKASLRAIARTPVLPTVAAPARPDVSGDPQRVWLGAKVRAIAGEEFSAFGVSKESGGVQVLELPPSSQAARTGLRVNDLIQGVGEHPVGKLSDLPSEPLGAVEIRIIRDQQPARLLLKD
jgi:hypothetical protein